MAKLVPMCTLHTKCCVTFRQLSQVEIKVMFGFPSIAYIRMGVCVCGCVCMWVGGWVVYACVCVGVWCMDVCVCVCVCVCGLGIYNRTN